MTPSTEPLTIGGVEIPSGETRVINLSLARLYDFTDLKMPIKVIRGTADGPRLFVSAAIHGDEINGVEIIRRLLAHKRLRRLRGTMIAVPVVNVFGFNNQSRYLPDRRDLNRCFPGSARGSLAARIAHIFMSEIVANSTHGIDLHSGARHRDNLPQIRASLDNDETRELAEAFGVPVIIHSNLRDGSLREAALERLIPMLLYEGGEALRHNEHAIRIGLNGILSVMERIGMLERKGGKGGRRRAVRIASTYWVRAPQSGTLRTLKGLGSRVEKGKTIGVVADVFNEHRSLVTARASGIVIGQTNLPLVNRGDALFHIATFDDLAHIERTMEEYESLLDLAPIDEDLLNE